MCERMCSGLVVVSWAVDVDIDILLVVGLGWIYAMVVVSCRLGSCRRYRVGWVTGIGRLLSGRYIY